MLSGKLLQNSINLTQVSEFIIKNFNPWYFIVIILFSYHYLILYLSNIIPTQGLELMMVFHWVWIQNLVPTGIVKLRLWKHLKLDFLGSLSSTPTPLLLYTSKQQLNIELDVTKTYVNPLAFNHQILSIIGK